MSQGLSRSTGVPFGLLPVPFLPPCCCSVLGGQERLQPRRELLGSIMAHIGPTVSLGFPSPAPGSASLCSGYRGFFLPWDSSSRSTTCSWLRRRANKCQTGRREFYPTFHRIYTFPPNAVFKFSLFHFIISFHFWIILFFLISLSFWVEYTNEERKTYMW